MSRYKKILKSICYSILFLLALVILFSFLPFKNNYKFLVVQTGSMQPKIKIGSLIITSPAKDYQVGDIVTYKIPSQLKKKVVITHRVIKVNGSGDNQTFVTQGDANNTPDTQPVLKSNILGKMRLKIPFIGLLISYAQTQLGLIVIIVIPATIIIYREGQKIRREINTIRQNRKSPLPSPSSPSQPSSPSKSSPKKSSSKSKSSKPKSVTKKTTKTKNVQKKAKKS